MRAGKSIATINRTSRLFALLNTLSVLFNYFFNEVGNDLLSIKLQQSSCLIFEG